MENNQDDILVIQGVNEDGHKMRPSNWIERISSTLASFGQDQRLRYAECAQPCFVNGEKCLVVTRGLSTSNPEMFQYIMNFAQSNRLRIFTDRRMGDRALNPVLY